MAHPYFSQVTAAEWSRMRNPSHFGVYL
ncbi:hypothetical protein CCACVL1_22589 [Corchorus capsularis]|uniref:Uncharacterized protein n=1 Tax=Corchorus capsularis TaxID=210143 RepID=A0A1R3GXQ9_COCAP|nr:hypothetical protein CCACVL1_22589 [Corchorus capsularis]